MMKPTITSVLLLSLILCGCTEKQSASHPAINRIQAGTNTTWAGGYVLHVVRRNGSSLKDVCIVSSPANGPKTIITADTGTIFAAANETAADQRTVKLILQNVRIEKDAQARKIVTTVTNMTIFLHK